MPEDGTLPTREQMTLFVVSRPLSKQVRLFYLQETGTNVGRAEGHHLSLFLSAVAYFTARRIGDVDEKVSHT